MLTILTLSVNLVNIQDGPEEQGTDWTERKP
jgi:hypothetical protein